MTTIRPIHPSEAAAVTDLYLDGCRQLSERDGDWGVPEWENIHRWVVRTMETDEAVRLVAEDEDGSVRGLLLASVSGHPAIPGMTGELDELVVHPGPRDRETKRALAEASLAWAKERGPGQISSRVALNAPWTDEELTFWTELGFEHDQTLVTQYPDGPAAECS